MFFPCNASHICCDNKQSKAQGCQPVKHFWGFDVCAWHVWGGDVHAWHVFLSCNSVAAAVTLSCKHANTQVSLVKASNGHQ